MAFELRSKDSPLHLPAEFIPLGELNPLKIPLHTVYKKTHVSILGKLVRQWRKSRFLSLVVNLAEIEGHDSGVNNLVVNCYEQDFGKQTIDNISKSINTNDLLIFTDIHLKCTDPQNGSQKTWAGFSTFDSHLFVVSCPSTEGPIKVDQDQIKFYSASHKFKRLDLPKFSKIFTETFQLLYPVYDGESGLIPMIEDDIGGYDEFTTLDNLKGETLETALAGISSFRILAEILHLRPYVENRGPLTILVTDYSNNPLLRSLNFSTQYKNVPFSEAALSLSIWGEKNKKDFLTRFKIGSILYFDLLKFKIYHGASDLLEASIKDTNTDAFISKVKDDDQNYINFLVRRKKYLNKFGHLSKSIKSNLSKDGSLIHIACVNDNASGKRPTEIQDEKSNKRAKSHQESSAYRSTSSNRIQDNHDTINDLDVNTPHTKIKKELTDFSNITDETIQQFDSGFNSFDENPQKDDTRMTSKTSVTPYFDTDIRSNPAQIEGSSSTASGNSDATKSNTDFVPILSQNSSQEDGIIIFGVSKKSDNKPTSKNCLLNFQVFKKPQVYPKLAEKVFWIEGYFDKVASSSIDDLNSWFTLFNGKYHLKFSVRLKDRVGDNIDVWMSGKDAEHFMEMSSENITKNPGQIKKVLEKIGGKKFRIRVIVVQSPDLKQVVLHSCLESLGRLAQNYTLRSSTLIISMQNNTSSFPVIRKRAPIADHEVATKYSVIVDAGSSGSRVQVFLWKESAALQSSLLNNQEGSREELLNSVPVITQDPELNKKISPGISSFAGNTRSLWKDHLLQLIEVAESGVPESDRPHTPIFVLATAGMRLLPEADQQEILKVTCEQLQLKTDFYLPECQSHVSIIDGETEALYGWISLNYLMGSFNSQENEVHSNTEPTSFGFMDMGGASIQIAFSPNSTETERHMNDLYNVRLRNLNGNNQEWKVFVSSWLGFGANEARRRYAQHLIEEENFKTSSYPQSLPFDPCYPRGLNHDMKINVNTTMSFEGRGNFTTCLQSMQPLLRKDQPCADDPCLFNGVHAPAIDFSTEKFVGVSEYWYTANDIFKLGGKYDFETFSSHVAQYCGMDWEDIKQETKPGGRFHGIPEDKLEAACFKATWVINILHSGFQLPIDESGTVLSLDDEGTLTYHRRDNDAVSPFTSASSVNSTELTWMLGRTVLYASSQVPSSSSSVSDVGFLPADISSKHFVAGGELEGFTQVAPSSVPQNLLPNMSPSSLLKGGFEVLGSLMLLAVLGYFILYAFQVLKHTRYFNWVMAKRSIVSVPMVVSRYIGTIRRAILGDGAMSYQRMLEEGGTVFSETGRNTPVSHSGTNSLHNSPPNFRDSFGEKPDGFVQYNYDQLPGLQSPFAPQLPTGRSSSMVDLSQYQNLRPPSRPSSRVSLFNSVSHWNGQAGTGNSGLPTPLGVNGSNAVVPPPMGGPAPNMLRTGSVTPQVPPHVGFLSPKFDPTDESEGNSNRLNQSPPLKRPSSRVFRKNM